MINVITHKIFDDSLIDHEHYRIIHVGKNDNCNSSYLRDDVGVNISDKNLSYCELTGQYWAWKNLESEPNEITGLVHYRRFFTTAREEFLYTYFSIKPKILSYVKIEETLAKVDIILPTKITIFRTVYQFYADLHVAEDLDITRRCIQKVFPEYLEAYDKVINGHAFVYGNMFLSKKKVFDQYCEWLYSLMAEIEKNIDLNKYTSHYQARVFGFLSERLLQVWVEQNNLKVKYYPVFNVEEKRPTIFEKNANRIRKVFKIKSI